MLPQNPCAASAVGVGFQRQGDCGGGVWPQAVRPKEALEEAELRSRLARRLQMEADGWTVFGGALDGFGEVSLGGQVGWGMFSYGFDVFHSPMIHSLGQTSVESFPAGGFYSLVCQKALLVLLGSFGEGIPKKQPLTSLI